VLRTVGGKRVVVNRFLTFMCPRSGFSASVPVWLAGACVAGRAAGRGGLRRAQRGRQRQAEMGRSVAERWGGRWEAGAVRQRSGRGAAVPAVCIALLGFYHTKRSSPFQCVVAFKRHYGSGSGNVVLTLFFPRLVPDLFRQHQMTPTPSSPLKKSPVADRTPQPEA